MKYKKTLSCLAVISLFITSSHAQIKLPAINNAVRNDVSKVMQDYPNKFKNLAGDILVDNPQATNFASTIQVEGAEECSVTKYSANKKDIYSWQAVMLTTEDFEAAQKKFKKLYTQLNNLQLKMDEKKSFRFTGEYEAPAEEKKFTTILFTAPESEVRMLKLELNMRFEFPEWKVMVLVYEREREDDESGRRDDGE